MQRLLLGLLALVVVAATALVLWFLPADLASSTDDGNSEPAAESARPSSPGPDEGLAESGPADVSDVGPTGSPAEPVSVSSASVDDPTTRREAPDGSRQLLGAIALPPGVPDEEVLTVMVVTQEPGDEEAVFEWIDADDPFADEAVFAVASVARDGSFEVAVPGEATEVWVLVDGRFVYADEPTEVRLGPAGSPLKSISIEGLLGGRVVGLLQPPDDASPDQLAGLSAPVELRANPTRTIRRGVSPFARESEADPAANYAFEFNAVRADEGYKLRIAPDLLAAASSDDFEVRSGQTHFFDLPLTYGGTLLGRVVDSNGDPVADAELEVGRDPIFFGVGGFEIREDVTSDADGSFRIEAVAAGKSTIAAERSGYLDGSLEVEIGEGQVVSGLEIVLENGLGIAGRVEWPDGTPVADTVVDVEFDGSFMGGVEAFNAMHGAEGSARTDADGNFNVTGLGKGPFTVTASEAVRGSSPDDDAPEWNARLDAVRPNGEALLLVLEEPLGVGGRVIDEAGVPVTEFEVIARTLTSGLLAGVGAESQSDEFVDADGTFFLSGLRPGEWELFPYAEGFGLAKSVRVEMPLPEGERVTLILERAASVAGIVVDSGDNPIAGADVRPHVEIGNLGLMAMDGFELPEATSDETGSFTIEGLTPGLIELLAEAEGFAKSTRLPLELEPGSLHEGVVLRVRTGGRILGVIFDDEGEPFAEQTILAQDPLDPTNQQFQISDDDGEFTFESVAPGTYQVMTLPNQGGASDMGAVADLLAQMKISMVDVVDGEDAHVALGAISEDAVAIEGQVTVDGDPVADTAITFFADGDTTMNSFQFVSTDSEGRFAAELASSGAYMISVQEIIGTGQQQAVEFFEIIPPADQSDGPHRLDLELPIASISGRVTGPDGAPAAAARVTLTVEGPIANGSFTGGNQAEVWTADDGTYELKWLRPGRYSVAAGGAFLGGLFGDSGNDALGRQVQHGIEIDADQQVRGIDFRLPAAGSIVGSVSTASGAPVADASIFLRDRDGNSIDRISFVASNAAGQFEYPSLAPGEYQVTARTGSDITQAPVLVRVESGKEATADLTLDAGTIVIVTLTDRSGDDVRCDLQVIGPDGEQVNGLWSLGDLMSALQDGRISSREQRVGPLAPGTYKLIASTADGLDAKKTLTLSGQPERRVRLRLK